MILEGGQRRYFYGKGMTYLFSYDVALAADAIGFVPGGFRVDLRGAGNGLASEAEAFHLLGDETVLGNDAVAGRVVWFAERLFVAEQNDIGTFDARLTIRTDDGALIWSRYQGRLRLGRMGRRRLLAAAPEDERRARGERGPSQGGAGASFVASAYAAPRFETDSSKWKWLAERQCAAYGRLTVEDGAIVQVAYDVYSAG